jgi:hypothetical protein
MFHTFILRRAELHQVQFLYTLSKKGFLLKWSINGVQQIWKVMLNQKIPVYSSDRKQPKKVLADKLVSE